jgi:hypothetical protein
MTNLGSATQPHAAAENPPNVSQPVIVVGLDGSPTSWDAFAWAAGEAARGNGTLTAVYATPWVELVAPFGAPFDPPPNRPGRRPPNSCTTRPNSASAASACTSNSSRNTATPSKR